MFQIQRKFNKNSVTSALRLITDHRLLITTLALALSGCMGVYEGGFECPPGEGVGCKSISEVNHMVDQGLGSHNPSSESAQKTENNEPVCKKGSGSCAVTSEIWYAPGFEVKHSEKYQTQDL
ncbi:MAG: hypothetical protein F9K49_06090, partial [Caedimonadaceae bacterium]